MKLFTLLGTFTLLSASVNADWDLFRGSCLWAVGPEDTVTIDLSTAASAQQGACRGATWHFGQWGEDELESGNPCDVSDRIIYKKEGARYRIVVKGTGISVGWCNPAEEFNTHCQYGLGSCVRTRIATCVTYYCHNAK